jgi:hypothetical protein
MVGIGTAKLPEPWRLEMYLTFLSTVQQIVEIVASRIVCSNFAPNLPSAETETEITKKNRQTELPDVVFYRVTHIFPPKVATRDL